ncbi:MAG: hypothetical protein GX758_02550 [Tenericutes bacterium]|nr:hypothetical protein [Mycoplasmatota bacterium]
MVSTVVNGINEPELNSLSMEILDNAELISELFDKIDSKIEELPEIYKSNSCLELINSYKDFRANYAVIKNNIVSYSDDLISLGNNMRENADYLTDMFVKYTQDTRSKTKEIESY